MTDASGRTRGVDAPQDLLAELCASPAAVDRREPLKPGTVTRVRLRNAPTLPSPVVVKRVPDRQREARTASWRLRTEPAALRFLGEDAGTEPAPRVIAADLTAGSLVEEADPLPAHPRTRNPLCRGLGHGPGWTTGEARLRSRGNSVSGTTGRVRG